MILNQRILNRFFSILRQAYQEKDQPQINTAWRQETMRRIRMLPAQAYTIPWSQMLGQLTWRLAPVASVIIIVFAIFLMSFDPYPEGEVFSLLTHQTDLYNLY